jgi:hypothetical protein
MLPQLRLNETVKVRMNECSLEEFDVTFLYPHYLLFKSGAMASNLPISGIKRIWLKQAKETKHQAILMITLNPKGLISFTCRDTDEHRKKLRLLIKNVREALKALEQSKGKP